MRMKHFNVAEEASGLQRGYSNRHEHELVPKGSPATTVILEATTSVTESPTKACKTRQPGHCRRTVRFLTACLQFGCKKLVTDLLPEYNRSRTKEYCVARLPKHRNTPPASAKPTDGPLDCRCTKTSTSGAVERASRCSMVLMGRILSDVLGTGRTQAISTNGEPNQPV